MIIQGLGIVSAIGCGKDCILKGLNGTAHPNIQTKRIRMNDDESNLSFLTPNIEGLERYIAPGKIRRMDAFSQMALLSTYLAVEDSGIDLKEQSRVGIVIGTGFGPQNATFDFLDGLIDYGDKQGASPTLFAGSVHNILASHISIAHGIQGPCQTLTAFDNTPYLVFLTALNWLGSGLVDYVIAGMGEECSPLGIYSASSIHRCAQGDLSPFDFNNCTWTPGEGFVAFILTSNDNGASSISINEVNRYSTIEKLNRNRLVEFDAVFIDANGDSSKCEQYKTIFDNSRCVWATSALYGSMPVGLGFELASACIVLENDGLHSEHQKHSNKFKRHGLDDKVSRHHHNSVYSCLSVGRFGEIAEIVISNKYYSC